MNPYRKVYTADELVRLDQGQQALLARWNQRPFTDGQPATFRVTLGAAGLHGNVAEHAYTAQPAATALTPVWDRDCRRLGLTPEFKGRGFTVYVPDTLHLRARWLPCSHDRACIGQALAYAGAAACMLYLARTVAGN